MVALRGRGIWKGYVSHLSLHFYEKDNLFFKLKLDIYPISSHLRQWHAFPERKRNQAISCSVLPAFKSKYSINIFLLGEFYFEHW